MPIEMPRGLPFSVDTWSPASMTKRHHFITHAHRDHSSGMSAYFSYPIYSTQLTKYLLLQHYHQLEDSLFVGIEAGQSVVIDDPDGAFTVTAFNANHCPGAVMFLFEGTFGNILHTGDCRLTPDCLQSLPEKYRGKKGKEPRCRLDFVFLDCTFGKFDQKMPSKHFAIRQVINCIWKHPDAPVVYLTCDLLGQEEILVSVSQTFGSKIYVDRAQHPGFFRSLTLIAPEILSLDPTCRFQLFDGFPKLYERAQAKLAEARANIDPEPLIIRPSTQWYAYDDESSEIQSERKLRMNEAIRDNFGVWHVCYSIHSSREELEWALELLAPKWVVSTTPNCWAMELDYVKKNCFASKIAADDPLWKLLDIGVEASSNTVASITGPSCSLVEEPSRISTGWEELENQCPPSKDHTLTLFGRARLSLHEFNNTLPQGKKSPLTDDGYSLANETIGVSASAKGEHAAEVKSFKVEREVVEGKYEKLTMKESKVGKIDQSPIRLSNDLRKLYRSMNVAVPQPLPSLVELMKANKRIKKRFELSSSFYG